MIFFVMAARASEYTIIQGTLEQHGFELLGSVYMCIFFNKYIGKIFGDLWQFEKTNCVARDAEKIKKKLGMSCIKYM